MKNFYLLFALCLCLGLNAQSEYADEVVEAIFDGSEAPDGFNDFYGGVVDGGCDEVLTDPSAVLGNTDAFVSLPTGSSLTILFVDNCVVDAPGQTDLFLNEVGASSEMAEVYISADGIDFTFFGVIDGGVVNELDLADINYDTFVKYVRLVGLDAGGCVPGFDIVSIYGLPGANCEAFAGLSTTTDTYCVEDPSFDLQSYVTGSAGGTWSGDGQNGGIVDPGALGDGSYTFTYTVEDPLPICPGDAQSITINVETCIILGCLDPAACNFNPAANTEDGSCLSLDCVGECGGSTLEGTLCDDNDDGTIDDAYNANCVCIGVPIFECDGALDTLELNRQGSLCADATEFPIDGNEVYTWFNENDEQVAVFTGIQYYAPPVLGTYYVVVTDPDYPICSQVLGPREIQTIDGCCELDGATLPEGGN